MSVTPRFADILSGILGLNILIILISFIFIKPKSRGKFLMNLGIFSIFMFVVFAYVNNAFDENPDQSLIELGAGEVASGGERVGSQFSQLKCALLGNLMRSEECIKLQNTEVAEVDSDIRVSISRIEREKLTLNSPEDEITVAYDFTTEVPIKVQKISCYTKENKDEAFYTEDLDVDINSDRSLNLKCKNLGKSIEWNKNDEINLEIFTKLEYTIDQSFNYQIPIVNCENSEIQNTMRKENLDCNELVLDTDKYTSIKSDDGLEIRVSTFVNELPVFVGDGEPSSKEMDLEFQINDKFGKLQKLEFIGDPVFPEALKTEKSFSEANLNPDIDDKLVIEIEFEENDASVESYPNDISYGLINFDTKVTFEKSGNPYGRSIRVIRDYELEGKVEDLEEESE